MKVKKIAWLPMLLLVAGLLLSPNMGTKANAAGFALYEWGARANALGGTLIGRADDPSAVAYNPAGITQLNGTQIYFGVTTVTPTNDITTTSGTGTKTENVKEQTFIIPQSFITHQLSDKAWIGLGAYSRYGLGTKYSEDWTGRYNVYNVFIESFSVSPVLAYKFNKYISASLGVELMYVRADLRSKIPNTAGGATPSVATDIDSRIIAEGVTPGYNLGVRITPNDQWALGVTYKSKMRHHTTGSASYENTGTMTGVLKDADVAVNLSTPASISTGLAYKPIDNLSFEFDAIWTQWSDYDKITYNFNNILGHKESEKKWKDVWRFQFGVEYSPIELLDLRAGYVYDQSPIREGYEDYMVPTNDRQIASTGFGLNFDQLNVDFSYMYIWSKDRTIAARPAEGIYDTKTSNGKTHLFGVSFGYKF